jgi:glycerol-1-phosphate dehydrogenase [NAD(P)+]
MFSNDTVKLLEKKISDMPTIIGGRSLKHDIDDLVASIFPPSKLAIVDDAQTSDAMGDHVHRALKGRFGVMHVTLAGTPEATTEIAAYVAQKAEGCDAFIAVGSGTINDICKYVSHKSGKPYAVFPTAASMNGYLSANASIADDGYKQTLAAHIPRAVFCDFSVIAAAPARLNKSGLGDSLARPTAQFDWLLSHLLLGTDYDETPFQILAALEPQLLDHARGIAKGDMASVELLMHVLLLSGLGMTMAGGSYPASQSEHMIAHSYGMLKGNTQNHATLHGEEIGVTSLHVAQLQHALLRQKPSLRRDNFPKEDIAALFGGHVADESKKAYFKKLERMEHSGIGGEIPARRWDEVVAKLEKTMLPPDKIRSVLEAADAPHVPEKLGWNKEQLQKATSYARFLRDRFTVLDLL